MPFFKPPEDTPEIEVPAASAARRSAATCRSAGARPTALPCRRSTTFERVLKSTEDREISTTQAFVHILQTLLRDKNIGPHVVPIVPDESRTFGMEGLFRQLGIWNQLGQLYTPHDADQLMFYREDKAGQILQEGINEPGGMCDWIAAATSYSTHGMPMIPFYIFYSMFGFQRVGDLAWAAGDMRARGFLLGGTSGRTTLNGEGLQHEDGHSHILARRRSRTASPTTRPSATRSAVIIQDGLRRMVAEQEDVYYYLTLMNENYAQPAMPRGRGAEDHQGHVPAAGAATRKPRRRACSCSASARSCAKSIAAAELLRRTGASTPTSGAARASPSWRATARRSSAGTCCIRRRSRASRTSTQQLADTRRPGDRRRPTT